MNKNKRNNANLTKYLYVITAFITACIFLPGCAGSEKSRKYDLIRAFDNELIKAGDSVQVDFTCSMEDGKIVMTTDESLAGDDRNEKAGIFLPLKEYTPISMVAGSSKSEPDYGNLKAMETEIFDCLSGVLPGMKSGSSNEIFITSEDITNLSGEDRFLDLPRIRKIEKQRKIHPVSFKEAYGKDPVKGDVITFKNKPEISMTVLTVAEDEVEVSINTPEGTVINTPLGKGTVYDRGDNYEAVIDIKKGQLIRSGVIVGRVVDVRDDAFTLDYANPFGGEKFKCEVVANKIGESN